LEEDNRRREEKKFRLLEQTKATTQAPTATQRRYREKVAQKAGGSFHQRIATDLDKRQAKIAEERKRQEEEELRHLNKANQSSRQPTRTSVEVATRMQTSMEEYARKQRKAAAKEREARQFTNLRGNGTRETGSSGSGSGVKSKSKSKSKRPGSAPARGRGPGFR
jgi:hypothetical protein